ncbi:MAG: glycosyltransferase family 2 protein [Candidatus Harrisonbacteria bacterium]|nr:glycosyltransferase family 2 protein [Candidatus Harrisonbacteria bacterium]
MNLKTLSIIIPVYNEKNTIAEILRRVASVNLSPIQKQIIIVDDGSTDKTPEILEKLSSEYLVLRHQKNLGKGAAIKTALPHLTGDYAIIQDADLEYDPADWPRMLTVMDENTAAVYGSRNLGNAGRGYFHYYFGGRSLTFITNLFFGSHLTDINTGYKLFRTDFLKSLNLKSNGFEFCEEVTCKILKRGGLIKEVPVRYQPRTFKEGKKISFKDGLIGIWTILKYRFKI